MADSPRERPARALIDNIVGAPLSVLLVIVAFVMINVLSARHYHRLRLDAQPAVHAVAAVARDHTHAVARRRTCTSCSVRTSRSTATSPSWRSGTRRRTTSFASTSSIPDRQRDRFLELTQRLGIRVGRTTDADVASEAAIVLVRGDRHWEIPRESARGPRRRRRRRRRFFRAHGDGADHGRARDLRGAAARRPQREHQGVLRDGPRRTHARRRRQFGLAARDRAAARQRDDAGRADRRHGERADRLRRAGVAGPRQAFSPSDADIVARYVRSGGNLLLLRRSGVRRRTTTRRRASSRSPRSAASS